MVKIAYLLILLICIFPASAQVIRYVEYLPNQSLVNLSYDFSGFDGGIITENIGNCSLIESNPPPDKIVGSNLSWAIYKDLKGQIRYSITAGCEPTGEFKAIKGQSIKNGSIPTVLTTPTSTPTPAPTPGFEAAFAIAGLLAIAYLLRRIRT